MPAKIYALITQIDHKTSKFSAQGSRLQHKTMDRIIAVRNGHFPLEIVNAAHGMNYDHVRVVRLTAGQILQFIAGQQDFEKGLLWEDK